MKNKICNYTGLKQRSAKDSLPGAYMVLSHGKELGLAPLNHPVVQFIPTCAIDLVWFWGSNNTCPIADVIAGSLLVFSLSKL